MNTSNTRYWDVRHWRFDDLEWRNKRKEEWKFVQTNLKIFARTKFSGPYLKMCKNLFFKGEIDDETFSWQGAGELGGLLPLLVVWFHPNFNSEEKERLLKWSIENADNVRTMEHCRKFCHFYSRKRSAKEYDESYGLFGGKERDVVDVFWGQPRVGALFDYMSWNPLNPKKYFGKIGEYEKHTDMRLVNSGDVSEIYWIYICRSMSNPGKYLNDIGRYLYKHADSADLSNLTNETSANVALAAQKLFGFNDLKEEVRTHPVAIELRDFLLEQYESRSMHPDFLEIWDQVRDGTYVAKD